MGDDGSGMLIEIFNDEGDFIEHKIAGVASNVGREASCKDRKARADGWCNEREKYRKGWEQSYARTDGKALDWIKYHLQNLNGEESIVPPESCKTAPWFDPSTPDLII